MISAAPPARNSQAGNWQAGKSQAGNSQAEDPQAGNSQARNSQDRNSQDRNSQARNSQARNPQAGPYTCTRVVNPSTGQPCNKTFSRPYALKRHVDTVHDRRQQEIRCPICPKKKTFSRNDGLARHIRDAHPEGESGGKRSKRGGKSDDTKPSMSDADFQKYIEDY